MVRSWAEYIHNERSGCKRDSDLFPERSSISFSRSPALSCFISVVWISASKWMATNCSKEWFVYREMFLTQSGSLEIELHQHVCLLSVKSEFRSTFAFKLTSSPFLFLRVGLLANDELWQSLLVIGPTYFLKIQPNFCIVQCVVRIQQTRCIVCIDVHIVHSESLDSKDSHRSIPLCARELVANWHLYSTHVHQREETVQPRYTVRSSRCDRYHCYGYTLCLVNNSGQSVCRICAENTCPIRTVAVCQTKMNTKKKYD